jgi:hypothetical protein
VVICPSVALTPSRRRRRIVSSSGSGLAPIDRVREAIAFPDGWSLLR